MTIRREEPSKSRRRDDGATGLDSIEVQGSLPQGVLPGTRDTYRDDVVAETKAGTKNAQGPGPEPFANLRRTKT